MKLKQLMLDLVNEAVELGERFQVLEDKTTNYATQLKIDGIAKIDASNRIKEALTTDLAEIKDKTNTVQLEPEWVRNHQQGYNQAIEEILELYKD